MALTGKTNDEKIWNYLKSNGFNEFGTAGLMGNLYAESGLKPTNLQNSSEKKLALITEIIKISLKTAPGMDWLNGRTGAESKICLHSCEQKKHQSEIWKRSLHFLLRN